MSAHLALFGWKEMRELLRRLPQEFAQRADVIVTRYAQQAEQALLNAYPEKTVQEHQLGLKEGVRLTIEHGTFGTLAELKSRSPVAHLWEFGTETRHTDAGWNRGKGPAHKDAGLVSIAGKTRLAIVDDVATMVTEAGFTVRRS